MLLRVTTWNSIGNLPTNFIRGLILVLEASLPNNPAIAYKCPGSLGTLTPVGLLIIVPILGKDWNISVYPLNSYAPPSPIVPANRGNNLAVISFLSVINLLKKCHVLLYVH